MNGNPLSDPQKQQAYSLFNDGFSYRQIAFAMGRDKKAVIRYLKSVNMVHISNQEAGKHLLDHVCSHCGVQFQTYNTTSKYCSRVCKDASEVTWTRDSILKTIQSLSRNGIVSSSGQATLVEVSRRMFGSWIEACNHAGVITARYSQTHCLVCNAPISFVTANHRRYCSDDCFNFANLVRWKNNWARRRGIQHSGDNINHLTIFERDGWRCKICHKLVRKSLRFPHPMCATLDHIVPISKGGLHCNTNVQLAHLSCNLQKHTKADSQPLLLG
jgi:predicted nucleic acid-binding Zn ribbon protein